MQKFKRKKTIKKDLLKYKKITFRNIGKTNKKKRHVQILNRGQQKRLVEIQKKDLQKYSQNKQKKRHVELQKKYNKKDLQKNKKNTP